MIKSALFFVGLALSSSAIAAPPAATEFRTSANKVVGAGDCQYFVRASPKDGTTFINISSITGQFHSYFGPLKKAQIPLQDGTLFESHQDSGVYGKSSVATYSNGIFELQEREYNSKRGLETQHTLRIAVSPQLTDVRFAEIEIIQAESDNKRTRHLACEF